MLVERGTKEQKALRRRERERRQLADQDAQISDEDLESAVEEESDWSAESSELVDSGDEGISDFNGTADGLTPAPLKSQTQRSMFRKAQSKASDLNEVAMRFNAIRFLAMNLKSQNGTLDK